MGLLRYALLLLWIIPLQQHSGAMFVLVLLTQLAMLCLTLWLSFHKEFSSGVVAVTVVCFEVVFMFFLVVIGLISVIYRETNSDEGFGWGTVPLVSLVMLLMLLKTL